MNLDNLRNAYRELASFADTMISRGGFKSIHEVNSVQWALAQWGEFLDQHEQPDEREDNEDE